MTKKIAIMTMLALLSICPAAFGASGVVETWNADCTKCTLVWTDANPASFTDYPIVGCTQTFTDISAWTRVVGIPKGWVVLVVTDPGAVAPTDNYDIMLWDENGCDIMGGALLNRDTLVSEQAVPNIGGTYGPRFLNVTSLTLDIDGQAVVSATGTIVIYIERE